MSAKNTPRKNILSNRLNKTIATVSNPFHKSSPIGTPVWKATTAQKPRRKTIAPVMKPTKSETKAMDTDTNIAPDINLFAKKPRKTAKYKEKALDEYGEWDDEDEEEEKEEEEEEEEEEIEKPEPKAKKTPKKQSTSAKATKAKKVLAKVKGKGVTPKVKNAKSKARTARWSNRIKAKFF